MPFKDPEKRNEARRKRRAKKREEERTTAPPPEPPGDNPTVPPMPLASAADALAILAEQVNAVRAGGSQTKGRTVAYLLAVALKALDVADLAKRIEALEAEAAGRRVARP